MVDQLIPEDTTDDTRESLAIVRWAKRMGGYAIWTMTAMALPLGVDRLVICPQLNIRLGRTVFDTFLAVRDIAYLLSDVSGNGFRLPFVRDLVRQPPDVARQFMRTSLVLSGVLSLLLYPVVGCIAYFLMNKDEKSTAAVLVAPFALYGVCRTLEYIIGVTLRIQRRFRTVFLLRLLEAAVLVSMIVVSPAKNLYVIGVFYAFSMAAPLVLSAYINREAIGIGKWIDAQSAKMLMASAPAGICMAAIESTRLYSTRPLLLMLGAPGQVTILFAGMSIANLFAAPSAMAGQTILSLLAGKKTFDLSGRRGQIYLIACLAFGLIVGLTAYFLGRLLVTRLYPNEAGTVLPFYHWFALSSSFISVRGVVKPIAMKYSPLKRVVGLSAFGVVAQLGSVAVLIPIWQARGAAIALAFSSFLSAATWIFIFQQLRNTQASNAS